MSCAQSVLLAACEELSLSSDAVMKAAVPFGRGTGGSGEICGALAGALAGLVVPFSPLAGVLGFTALPVGFLGILLLMVVTHLGMVEAGKSRFFHPERPDHLLAERRERRQRRVHRLAARWSRKSGAEAG